MKWRAIGLAVLVGLALAACSGMRVQSDWDPEVDFSQFQTFTFLNNQEPALSSLVDRRIRAAIGDQLSAEGLREVDSLEDADLAIGYQVATERRHTYETVSTGWDSPGFRQRHRSHWQGPMATSTTQRRDYTVGTLVIAAFETKGNELVWEGSGSRRVSGTRSPEESRHRIISAVERIMRDFPPES